MTIFPTNLGGMILLAPPGYAYASKSTKSRQNEAQ